MLDDDPPDGDGPRETRRLIRDGNRVSDHLEKLGLAQRQVVLHDKRVKLVILTSKGQKARMDLLNEFHQPPVEFAALERADLEALERVLTKMTASWAGREPSRR
jgi:DNA-binding MarR family transcriptional regulator